MHFPRIIPTEILETMKSKEITFLLQTNNTGIRQVVLNKHSARAHDLERPKKKARIQTPKSNTKIPLALSLQASLLPHPEGKHKAQDRNVRRG